MSVVEDIYPLGIKEEDLEIMRNDQVKFCGPLVYRTIIHWGFALPDGRKIKDHINYLKIEEKIKEKCNVNLKHWMDINEFIISRDSFCDFDITSLHHVLPILCYDKIAQTGKEEHHKQTRNPKSVESLLRKINAFRNDVSAEAVEESHIDHMRETMIECISTAGKLYGKDQTEIDEKVKKLDDEFNRVLHKTTHLYKSRVKCIAQKISVEVPSNMLKRYSSYFYVHLPGRWIRKDTPEIFQCSNLALTIEIEGGKTKDNTTAFPCTEIFNNKYEKFIVINGGPGSGKTTLMRNMFQDILQTLVHGSTPSYEKIEQFKIPIFIDCKSEQQPNLSKYLKEYLEYFHFPEDDIYEAFKILEGSVFFIDGYDKINNNSRQLLDSIVDFCLDYNGSCIVSSQVEAGNNFFKELQERKLNCRKYFIKPISSVSDKVTFLRSYAEKIDELIDTDKLVNNFENLSEAVIEFFSSPILLILFISLFVHEPDSIFQMKDEQSAIKAVFTNLLSEVERILRDVHNPKEKAKEVADVLSKFCIKLFRAKKYFLDGTDYLKIVTECEKIRGIPSNVSIPSLLSCILTPEHSFKFSYDTSYQFRHCTMQEFFAAKYVSESLKKLQENRRSHIQSEDAQLSMLLQIMELDASQRDIKREIKRYGNIIKFLMLETLNNGELPKNSSTFTQLLKKYYGPKDYSPTLAYLLDLILSSDSNADIISIVSDCLVGWKEYTLKYHRHIKPMTEVIQKFKIGVKINVDTFEVTNSQQIINLLKVLGDDSEIELHLYHSFMNYQSLEGEFYTHLKSSKCKVTGFTACITAEEHLSSVVKNARVAMLQISTPSVSNISFAALKNHKRIHYLRVKYSDDCPSTGSNQVSWATELTVENIPADGKESVCKMIKYLCPKSKEFWSIYLHRCHLRDSDINDLLKLLHTEKIRTKEGELTESQTRRYNKDKSRDVYLYLKDSEEEERDKRNDSKSKWKMFRNFFNRIF